MPAKPAGIPRSPDRPGKHADLLYENYVKEMFLDSDTKVALISSAPADDQDSYFLTNSQMADDRQRINATAGSRRLFSHGIIIPGQPGGLDDIDRQLATTRPDSWKGYTIGDPTAPLRIGKISSFPWRMDDEKVAYPVFDKIARSGGSKIICVHKGLFPLSAERSFPSLRAYSDVSDVGKAAKDWPQLTFIIYHAGYRHVGGDPADAVRELETTGRLSWVSDLAEIPARFGVSNVYADIGMSFAEVTVAQPRRPRRCWGSSSADSVPTTSCGAPTRSGPVLRNGRSRACGGSRSPRTCDVGTDSLRSEPPMAQ